MVFLCGVVRVGDGFTGAVRRAQRRDDTTPAPVLRIGTPWVILGQLQHVAAHVRIVALPWLP
jgi:hypothetical protein